MTERILVVGSGGREHAIGWKLQQDSSDNRELFFAPGNGGTQELGKNIDIDSNDIDRLAAFASDNNIDLTVVGPEKPLANGIVNVFNENHLPIFGHTQEASILESDKAEAVLFMDRHNIDHPRSVIFTNCREAERFIENVDATQIVIKASGLADGKGVVLPDSQQEAFEMVRKMMVDDEFGEAGRKIVIQEKLLGNEASVIGFVSNDVGLLVSARDYKRAFDEDKGLNTGGMGVYAPNNSLDPSELREIYYSIMLPTMNGMKAEGKPLSGILYAGIILTNKGPKVIEYNVRFGDPETQVQMRLLQSDLLESMKACVAGELQPHHYQSSNEHAVGVVVAASGYPGRYRKGHEVKISKDNLPSEIVIFHAGTEKENDKLISSGGRVLTVTATGKTKSEARNAVYNVIGENGISMDNGFYRTDIGS